MKDVPDIALSVRQPWAWAIIHAGKDIENRSSGAVRMGLMLDNLRIAIHAAKGLTREEYEDGASFMASLGIACPPPHALVRGAIIGSVYVEGIVKSHRSPWFFGPRGLLLSDPVACDPIPVTGQLGYFRWNSQRCETMPEPARWMLQLSLFGD